MDENRKEIKKFARSGTVLIYLFLVFFLVIICAYEKEFSKGFLYIQAISCIVSVLVLCHYRKAERMSINAYTKMASLFFVLVSIDIGYYSKNIFVYLLAMIFPIVAAIIYLDRKIFKLFQLSVIVQLIAFIIYRMAAYGFGNDERKLILYLVIYTAITIILLTFIDLIEYENKKNEEQERSLDDMLKIITIKCDDARSATKSKSAFLANMSHEIRTPINAVLGMNEMILRQSGEEDTKKYAMDIKAAASSLLSIINDILDISKIESGKMELVEVNYELGTLINDIYNMSVLWANDKDIFLDVYVDEDLPREYIGDDVRIKQILVNLVSNAIKYTPSGTVIIDVSGEVDESGEASLHFEVTDTGTGIKEEDLPKLFEKFERIEMDKNKYIEGTGLGLSITVHLLKMMNSKLNVKSTYGYGSMFSFDLKQKVVNNEPIGDFRDTIHRVMDEYEYDVTFVAPDAHVLIVDDNDINRSVFMGLLKDTEIQITDVDSGFKCLEMVRNNHYDIIFMDHMMPEMDGIETFQRMCEMQDNMSAGVPVIMLTANAVSGAKEMYLEKGFSDFLAKPVSPEKLEVMVKKYIPQELFIKKKVARDDERNGEGTEDSQGGSAVSVVTSDGLPEIEDIDWQYALLRIPDKDIILQTAKSFYLSIDGEKKRLMELIELVDDEQYLEEYRIKVHSLKSTSAMIGAMTLSSISKILEFASRDKKVDKVKAINPSLMEELDKFKQRLSVLDENAKPEKPLSTDVDTLAILMEFVKRYLEEIDYEKCDATMEEILRFRYQDDIQEKIEILQKQVENMDAQAGADTAQEVLDMLQ